MRQITALSVHSRDRITERLKEAGMKLRPHNPAQKQTERCHPAETRPLTIREYARIQTFPDDWKFSGSISSQYRQIGNAVPVNLGFHIGIAIRAMFEKMPKKLPTQCTFEQKIEELTLF